MIALPTPPDPKVVEDLAKKSKKRSDAATGAEVMGIIVMAIGLGMVHPWMGFVGLGLGLILIGIGLELG